MKHLLKDYGEFYKKNRELVREHKRSVTFVTVLAIAIYLPVAFAPIIVDKIEGYTYQKKLDKMKEDRD